MKQLAGNHVKSRAIMYNAAKDVERGSYPNLSKNIIKFKRNSVFSSFVGAIGWLSLLFFGRLNRFDYQSDYWFSYW